MVFPGTTKGIPDRTHPTLFTHFRDIGSAIRSRGSSAAASTMFTTSMARISSSKPDPLDSCLRSTSFVCLPTRSPSQSATLMSANRLQSSCRPSCVREPGRDVLVLPVVIAFSVSSTKIAGTHEKPKGQVGRPCFLVGRSLLLVRACAHTRTYRVWAQTLYERPSMQKRIRIFLWGQTPYLPSLRLRIGAPSAYTRQ